MSDNEPELDIAQQLSPLYVEGVALPSSVIRQVMAWGAQCMEAGAKKVVEQEPLGWMVYTQDGQSAYVTDNPTDIQDGQRALPFYITPPRSEWVGLTNREKGELIDMTDTDPQPYHLQELIDVVESKLKERNT